MHKSIFGRDPVGELTTLPQTHSQMVRRYPAPCFLPLDALGVSISAYKNDVVIGPRNNGFPGPAAALDGPDWVVALNMAKLQVTE